MFSQGSATETLIFISDTKKIKLTSWYALPNQITCEQDYQTNLCNLWM